MTPKFLSDNTKIFARYVALNDDNKKQYIHPLLWIIVNVIVGLIFLNIHHHGFTFLEAEHNYYIYMFFFHLASLELLLLTRLIIQFCGIRYELIYNIPKYKPIKKILWLSTYLYCFSLIGFSAYYLGLDFNDKDIHFLMEKYYYFLGISVIIFFYKMHIDAKTFRMQKKYNDSKDDNGSEILKKITDCFIQIIIHSQSKLRIEGEFLLHHDYLNTRQEDGDVGCPICMENFDTHDNIFKTKCEHVYHDYCIVRWMLNNTNCPMCRKEIFSV